MKKLDDRWETAINRALEINGESAARYLGHGEFLILSATDPERGAYRVRLQVVDGTPVVGCSCPAASFGQPCWHRATVELMAGLADVPAAK